MMHAYIAAAACRLLLLVAHDDSTCWVKSGGEVEGGEGEERWREGRREEGEEEREREQGRGSKGGKHNMKLLSAFIHDGINHQ